MGNFQAWRGAILADAVLIKTENILLFEQAGPPETTNNVALWWKKNEALYTRMWRSLDHDIREMLPDLDGSNAVYLWKAIHDELGISKAEERL
jgi:hypothetical protein